jgi:hypothetical protein
MYRPGNQIKLAGRTFGVCPLTGLKLARWAFLKVTIRSQRQTALRCQPAEVVSIGNCGDSTQMMPDTITCVDTHPASPVVVIPARER